MREFNMKKFLFPDAKKPGEYGESVICSAMMASAHGRPYDLAQDGRVTFEEFEQQINDDCARIHNELLGLI
jgi:hypothetical protein